MKTAHICLVSAQLLPNLIPILMDKPDAVILVSSEEMNWQTQRFKTILEQENITVDIRDSAPSSDLTKISSYFCEMKSKIRLDYSDSELILNITGGTKLMTLGVFDMFRDMVHHIIYTDTAKNRIEYLPMPNATSQPEIYKPLESVVNVPLYLQCYGADYRGAESDNQQWQQTFRQRIALTCAIAEEAQKGLISMMNALAGDARDDSHKTLCAPEQFMKYSPTRHQQMFLKMFDKANLIEWDGMQTITFKDYDSARYLGGIWLEEYVYHCAVQLKPYDVQCGVEIIHGKDVPNELDVVIAHNNRLLLFECKTGNMGMGAKKTNATSTKPIDIIYKLDSIATKHKGLYGKSALVSMCETPAHIKERTDELNIEIIETNVSAVNDSIRKWMANA